MFLATAIWLWGTRAWWCCERKCSWVYLLSVAEESLVSGAPSATSAGPGLFAFPAPPNLTALSPLRGLLIFPILVHGFGRGLGS